jgi:lycopene cyclase domain-containing protein
VAEYTVTSLIACAVVVGLELVWFKTRLFRMKAFWISWIIVLIFQCLMDGWLTKLSAPIVLYRERFATGWRFPWDIPIEDFAFGFSLITLALLLWVRSDSDC